MILNIKRAFTVLIKTMNILFFTFYLSGVRYYSITLARYQSYSQAAC
jgi:hypothetical protein